MKVPYSKLFGSLEKTLVANIHASLYAHEPNADAGADGFACGGSCMKELTHSTVVQTLRIDEAGSDTPVDQCAVNCL